MQWHFFCSDTHSDSKGLLFWDDCLVLKHCFLLIFLYICQICAFIYINAHPVFFQSNKLLKTAKADSINTLLSGTNRLLARASKKCPVSFSGTQRKFLLSCLLLAIESWLHRSLCRSLCCPFTQRTGNISSSYISFSLRYRRKLEWGVQRFCQRRSLLLSWSQSPSVLPHATCPTRGWGKQWVPHAGLGEAVGAAVGPRGPSCWYTAGQYRNRVETR